MKILGDLYSSRVGYLGNENIKIENFSRALNQLYT